MLLRESPVQVPTRVPLDNENECGVRAGSINNLYRDGVLVPLSQRNTSVSTILSTSISVSAFSSASFKNLPYSPSSTVISASKPSSTWVTNTCCSHPRCSY